jgi:hypothetical protein
MRHLLDLFLNHRTQLVAVLLIVCLVAPQPVHAQLGLGGLISAISGIGSAILNVIAPALRTTNSALGTLNGILNALQTFFQTVVYPPAAIARAQGLVGALGGLYASIRSIATINVASATLPVPQTFEGLVLSRNPMNIPTVTTQYQTLYQTVPTATDAAPEQRDMIDMTDAAAQDAFKRSVALDGIADTEMQAADQINQELQAAAPGTAPMIEAEAAAWLVRANAYTQSALSDVIRVRAIALANSSDAMKFNAASAAEIRQNSINSFK